MAAVLLFDTAFYAAITPLIPYDVHHYRLTPAAAGVLVAGYPLGTFAFAFPGGVLAARRGARWAVLAGVTLTGVSTVVFGWAHEVPLMVAARVVEGVGGSFSWAGALAWLNVASPVERRAETIGGAFGAAAAGAIAGPVLGGLATVIGPGPAFSVAGAAALALAGVALRLPPPRREGRTPARRLLAAAGSLQFSAGLGLVALAGVSFGVLDVLAPLRLAHLGLTSVAVAGVFLVAAALETVLAPAVGRFADRRGRRRPLQVSLAAAVGLSLLAPVVGPALALAGVVVLCGLAFGLIYTPATALVADGADRVPIPQGMAAAALNLVWAVGASVGASGGGSLAGATGYLPPFALLAGICAVAFVGVSRVLAPAR